MRILAERVRETRIALAAVSPTLTFHGCIVFLLPGQMMLRGVQVSAGRVRGVWIRHGLKRRHERLPRLEKTVRESDFELTEEQILALERFDPEYRERHIEVKKTGELLALDTFSRYVWARLYTSKMPVAAVQILNNHVLPFFEEHEVKVETILSDNGREF